jgi:hypothetical protein
MHESKVRGANFQEYPSNESRVTEGTLHCSASNESFIMDRSYDRSILAHFVQCAFQDLCVKWNDSRELRFVLPGRNLQRFVCIVTNRAFP